VTAILLTIFLLVGVTGCSKEEEAVEQAATETQPQAVEQTPVAEAPPPAEPPPATVLDLLKNATYIGIKEQDPVTLKSGLWEGEPAAEGSASRPRVEFLWNFHRLGDMDGDGKDEAAVALVASSGGTGETMYVAVLGLRDGKWQNLDTVLVGDRVRIRKAAILEGRFFMDMLRHGPEDPMCCPGELNAAAWRLENGKLVDMQVKSAPLRLSVEALGPNEWVLAWWNIKEKAPSEPEVTLAFSEGRLAGSSGCNNWFTEPKDGKSPGEVSLGAVGATQKMCPEDVMAVEQRFLSQLENVKRYGYMAGMLALTYEFNGDHGVMLFEERRRQ
jgi:heat shock protein HslJ